MGKATAKKAAKKAPPKRVAKKQAAVRTKPPTPTPAKQTDAKFYFELTGTPDEWQVRQGDKRIGKMIKENGKYRPKNDRHKDKIYFDTQEECARQLVKINEAKQIYRSWKKGWRGLSEAEQKKFKWIQDLFRYM